MSIFIYYTVKMKECQEPLGKQKYENGASKKAQEPY